MGCRDSPPIARRGDSRERSRGFPRSAPVRGDRYDDRYINRSRINDDEPLGTSTIWIGGCPPDLEESEIERVCLRYGKVYNVTKRSSERDTFFFVHFGNEHDARDAIRLLDRTQPFGTGLIMVSTASRPGRPSARHKHENGYTQGSRGEFRRPRHDSPDARRGNFNGRARDGRCGTGEETYVRGRSYDRAMFHDSDKNNNRGREHGQHYGRAASDHRRERCVSYQESNRFKSDSPQPQIAKPPRRFKVYISQMPRDMDEDEFLEVASEYGQTLSHSIERQGTYKFGWVEYASKSEALNAIQELDDREMQGWHLRLQAYMYPTG